ncbi:MAG: YaeQ family protein [Gammaproteobacteria bacterium]|nr:YaeQ family protein [Gammaproteobacteria bacterium]
MALNATIFRCALQVSDLDRGYYGSHDLTIARHPSETDERMMVRLLTFALNASDRLAFSRGLSQDDEPDLWQRSLSDEIELWIELGQPDEKRIRKACARAAQVIIYTFQQRAGEVWWRQVGDKLERFDHLAVYRLPQDAGEQLAAFAQRNMDLQCTIQDGEIWLSSENANLQFVLERLR